MWSHEKVERALFSWWKWRQSIMQQWIIVDEELIGLTHNKLREKIQQELTGMGFPISLWLEVYWVCCVISDHNLDDWSTYDNIVIPAWLLSFDYPYRELDHIEAEMRCYPPEILNERDLDHFARQYMGGVLPDRSILYPRERHFRIFLPSQHEFYNVLGMFKGRPRTTKKRGKPSKYSDRLAIRCAVMRDEYRMKYVEIAQRFDLPRTKPYDSWQSDVTRQLIYRGRRLLQNLEDSISSH
jgi:hypothetical protein